MTQRGLTTGITTRCHPPIYLGPIRSFRYPLDRNVFSPHRTCFFALFGRTVGVFEWYRDCISVPLYDLVNHRYVLFIKHLCPGGSCFNSLESNNTTNVRGLVGGGVLKVNLQTSAICGWKT